MDANLRLNRIVVETGGGPVILLWSSRQELLAELRGVPGTETIVNAFEAVGASRPIAHEDVL